MPYLWTAGTAQTKYARQNRQARRQKAGISKKHTVFFTRYATFCCLVGLRIHFNTVTGAQGLSTTTVITASVWPVVQTIKSCISEGFHCASGTFQQGSFAVPSVLRT
jgi:hypothetical protein